MFYGHKLILSSVSESFKVMFTLGMAESNNNTIEINNISSKAFSLLLYFAYFCNLKLFEDQLHNFELMFELFQIGD